MQNESLKIYIIEKLINYRIKKEELIDSNSASIQKSKLQEKVDNLESLSLFFNSLAYLTTGLTITLLIIWIFNLATWPNTNQSALLILWTIASIWQYTIHKARLTKLKEQILLITMLEKL